MELSDPSLTLICILQRTKNSRIAIRICIRVMFGITVTAKCTLYFFGQVIRYNKLLEPSALAENIFVNDMIFLEQTE